MLTVQLGQSQSIQQPAVVHLLDQINKFNLITMAHLVQVRAFTMMALVLGFRQATLNLFIPTEMKVVNLD